MLSSATFRWPSTAAAVSAAPCGGLSIRPLAQCRSLKTVGGQASESPVGGLYYPPCRGRYRGHSQAYRTRERSRTEKGAGSGQARKWLTAQALVSFTSTAR